MSLNRHWFGRLVLAAWVLCIAVFAFLAPDSIPARAMEAAGHGSYILMAAILLLALGALVDSAIHDVIPGALQQLLMLHRHGATMALAILLVIEGGVLSVRGQVPMLVGPFLLLAVLCGFVTFLDLWAKNKERRAL